MMQGRSKKPAATKLSATKPAWDSTSQDHQQFREDRKEQERRRATRVSKHLAAARAQLAVSSGAQRNGAAPHQRKQDAAVLRRVFFEPDDMLDVLARTDRALGAVQDVFAGAEPSRSAPDEAARQAAALRRLCPGVDARALELPCPLDELSAGIVRARPLNQLPTAGSASEEEEDELAATRADVARFQCRLEAEQRQEEPARLPPRRSAARRQLPWRGAGARVVAAPEAPGSAPQRLASSTAPELRLSTLPAVTPNPLNMLGTATGRRDDVLGKEEENVPAAAEEGLTVALELGALREELRLAREERAAAQRDAQELRRLLDAVSVELLRQDQKQQASAAALRRDQAQLRWDLRTLAAANGMCQSAAAPTVAPAPRLEPPRPASPPLVEEEDWAPSASEMLGPQHTAVLDQINALQAEHREAQLRLKDLLRRHHEEDGDDADVLSDETEVEPERS